MVRKVLLEATITGGNNIRHAGDTHGVAAQNDNVPYGVVQIIEQAMAAYEAGARLLHIHNNGAENGYAVFSENDYSTIRAALAEHCPDAVVSFTTSKKGLDQVKTYEAVVGHLHENDFLWDLQRDLFNLLNDDAVSAELGLNPRERAQLVANLSKEMLRIAGVVANPDTAPLIAVSELRVFGKTQDDTHDGGRVTDLQAFLFVYILLKAMQHYDIAPEFELQHQDIITEVIPKLREVLPGIDHILREQGIHAKLLMGINESLRIFDEEGHLDIAQMENVLGKALTLNPASLGITFAGGNLRVRPDEAYGWALDKVAEGKINHLRVGMEENAWEVDPEGTHVIVSKENKSHIEAYDSEHPQQGTRISSIKSAAQQIEWIKERIAQKNQELAERGEPIEIVTDGREVRKMLGLPPAWEEKSVSPVFTLDPGELAETLKKRAQFMDNHPAAGAPEASIIVSRTEHLAAGESHSQRRLDGGC